jgi:hypothetical protein
MHQLQILTLAVFALLVSSALATAQSPIQTVQAASDDAMRSINPRQPAAMSINEERVAANGIRKIKGNYLTLYTDVRGREDIDELPAVFDAAVPQWCKIFSVDPARAKSWHLRAFVMEETDRFKNAGLMGNDLPFFPAGFQHGHETWVKLQPGTYYTRHLLLHEGTHAFMDWFLGGLGSPSYAEGMAELVGLHRWEPIDKETNAEGPNAVKETKKLQLGYRVRDRRESEHWGRVKLLREAWAAGKVLTLSEVLNFPVIYSRNAKSYAWAWAACEFLSKHDLSKKTFAELLEHVKLPPAQFNARLQIPLAEAWPQLERDWQLFLSEMEYGYEIHRGQITRSQQAGHGGAGESFSIRADHSWQTTELTVKRGERYRIRSASKFFVGKTGEQPDERRWPCEPNGITLEYYRGQPLGMLMAGVVGVAGERQTKIDVEDQAKSGRISEKADAIAGLQAPHPVGYDSIIEIERRGRLCLRINESPAKLDDNQGVLEVSVEKLE